MQHRAESPSIYRQPTSHSRSAIPSQKMQCRKSATAPPNERGLRNQERNRTLPRGFGTNLNTQNENVKTEMTFPSVNRIRKTLTLAPRNRASSSSCFLGSSVVWKWSIGDPSKWRNPEKDCRLWNNRHARQQLNFSCSCSPLHTLSIPLANSLTRDRSSTFVRLLHQTFLQPVLVWSVTCSAYIPGLGSAVPTQN